MKRKESLRDSYARRQREKFKADAKAFVARKLGKKTPLKKISKSLRRRQAEYYALQTAFLARPENALCAICKARREAGEARYVRPATECHHARGRISRLLTWEPGLRASCRDCREWVHANVKFAREHGLICTPAEWNVFPAEK